MATMGLTKSGAGKSHGGGGNSKWCLVLMGWRRLPRPSFYSDGRISSEVTRGGFE